MNLRCTLTLVLVAAVLTACAGSPPTNIGAKDGKLADCPSSPNCVSSQTDSTDHAIKPLPFTGTPEAAKQRLKAIIGAMPDTKLVRETSDYLYFEFTSATMGFVDDVEFYLSGDTIHLRSASRTGYSDMGANRERIEAIRAAWSAAP